MAEYDTGSTQSLFSQYKRSSIRPVDMSSMFNSYEDAVEYAKGKYKKPGEYIPKAHDERGLAGASYVGQIITICDDDDNVKNYSIQADRTLKEIDSDTIDCGEF